MGADGIEFRWENYNACCGWSGTKEASGIDCGKDLFCDDRNPPQSHNQIAWYVLYVGLGTRPSWNFLAHKGSCNVETGAPANIWIQFKFCDPSICIDPIHIDNEWFVSLLFCRSCCQTDEREQRRTQCSMLLLPLPLPILHKLWCMCRREGGNSYRKHYTTTSIIAN